MSQRLFCRGCAAPQRFERAPLAPGLECLGSCLVCDACRRSIVGVSTQGRPYCTTCEDFVAARLEPSSVAGRQYVLCRRCEGLLAVVYSDETLGATPQQS